MNINAIRSTFLGFFQEPGMVYLNMFSDTALGILFRCMVT